MPGSATGRREDKRREKGIDDSHPDETEGMAPIPERPTLNRELTVSQTRETETQGEICRYCTITSADCSERVASDTPITESWTENF